MMKCLPSVAPTSILSCQPVGLQLATTLRWCGQRVASLAVQMSTTMRHPSPPSLTLTLLSATMPSAATLLGDPCILRALHALPAPPLPLVSTLFARPPKFEQEAFCCC